MSNPKRKSSPRASQVEINRVAIGLYQVMFAGQKDDFYKPREGTIVFRCWDAGKLDFRQQRAWKKFMEDVEKAAGKSGKVTGSYQQAVQVSGNRSWSAYTNQEFDRQDYATNHFLSRKERTLLRDLVSDDLRPTGVFHLEGIGLARNGYKNDSQARASGVTSVCNLLDRIADFYGY